jgi:predicted nuclease with TOPRIM domain
MMTADAENLILERLRRMDGRLDAVQSDVREIKERIGHLESGQAELQLQYATLSTRVDRIDTRLDRIERRLEFADG